MRSNRAIEIGFVGIDIDPSGADPWNCADPKDQRADTFGAEQFLLEPCFLLGAHHGLLRSVLFAVRNAFRAQVCQNEADSPDGEGLVDGHIAVPSGEWIVR